MLELKFDPSAPMPDQDVAGKWDASIVVYCLQAPGFRSLAAADTLARMGYTNVFSIKGGFKALVNAGWQVTA